MDISLFFVCVMRLLIAGIHTALCTQCGCTLPSTKYWYPFPDIPMQSIIGYNSCLIQVLWIAHEGNSGVVELLKAELSKDDDFATAWIKASARCEWKSVHGAVYREDLPELMDGPLSPNKVFQLKPRKPKPPSEAVLKCTNLNKPYDMALLQRIALMLYTLHDVPDKDRPFFSKFNLATRLLSTDLQVEAYPYKSFFYLLYMGLTTLASRMPNYAQEEVLRQKEFYRGISYEFDYNVSEAVEFDQFTSLSTDKAVALGFALAGKTQKLRTLLIIRGLKHHGISMREHTKFGSEHEYLVSPFHKYEVVSLEEKSTPLDLDVKYREVTMVRLEGNRPNGQTNLSKE